jgi:hypothetical protein
MRPAFAGGGGHRGGDKHEAHRHGGGHDRGHDGCTQLLLCARAQLLLRA